MDLVALTARRARAAAAAATASATRPLERSRRRAHARAQRMAVLRTGASSLIGNEFGQVELKRRQTAAVQKFGSAIELTASARSVGK